MIPAKNTGMQSTIVETKARRAKGPKNNFSSGTKNDISAVQPAWPPPLQGSSHRAAPSLPPPSTLRLRMKSRVSLRNPAPRYLSDARTVPRGALPGFPSVPSQGWSVTPTPHAKHGSVLTQEGKPMHSTLEDDNGDIGQVALRRFPHIVGRTIL